MNDPNHPERPRSRVRRRANKVIYLVVATIVAVAIGSYFYVRQNPSAFFNILEQKIGSPSSEKARGQTENTRPPAGHQQTSGDLPGTNIVSGEILQKKTGGQPDHLAASPIDAGDDNGNAAHTSAKDGKFADQPPSTGKDSQQLIDDLNTFYSHLDRESYMQDFHLKEPSKVHFSKLLQKLIDNPPNVTRETDDLFTLLRNTAHFFRILGKDNIIVLKGILDREKDSFEKILKTFYALTDHPDYLKKEYALTIPQDNLHDYAGFFLNTIGGRLYLFRRDSASRMTISYYAILVIDRANRQGNGRLGIDLKPAIDLLIEEIENNGKSLQMREEYLDTLYDLKEYYGNRG